MATHILDGRSHPLMFWGANYGGTIEPHLVAVAFFLFGATPAVYQATMCVLYALYLAGTGTFVWRFFGRRAALAACAWLALPPFHLPYRGLNPDGTYGMIALLGLAALFLACLADERLAAARPAIAVLAAFGFTTGLGLWVSPVTIPTAGAAALWLLAGHPRRLPARGVIACAGGALVGAAPWIVWNLRHGWASVKAPELAPATARGLQSNIPRFLTDTLPVFLGAARPNFSNDPHASFPGARVLVPLLVLVLVLPAVAAARRDRRLRLLFFVLVALSVGAVTSGRLAPSEPRFLIAGYAALAALIGVAFTNLPSRGSRMLFAGGLGLLLASNVSSAFHAHRHLRDTDDSQVTGPLGPLMAELRSRGITRVWTNYWAAYRITFESGESIVAAPIPREDTDRYAPIQEAVRTAPDPAVVLLPPRDDCFRRYLAESGEPFAEARSDSFTIFHALPAPVRDLVRAAGALPMPARAYRPVWSAVDLPTHVGRSEEVLARARVTNEGPCTWMNNVRLVAVWTGPETRETAFATPDRRVAPGETADLTFPLRAPERPGDYALRLDLEQDGIARFSAKGGATVDTRLTVAP
jgi:Ig-like domain from next to BRCA1 gene